MNIYSVLHHVLDKLPARDEGHLRDLHDTVTAHELGYNSLEELNEDRRLQAAKIDPAAAAAAFESAQQLLAQVQQNQASIIELLKTAEAGRKASAEAAAAKGAEESAQAAPATAGVQAFPQAQRASIDDAAELQKQDAPPAFSVADLEAMLEQAKAAQGGGA